MNKLKVITILLVAVLLMAISAVAQPSACEEKCTARDGPCYELASESPHLYAQCVAQCKQKCASSPPSPPVVLHLKFMVLGIIYAPPGCTSTASTACGDKGSVDYAGGSSLGSKVSVKDSFKLEAKESLDLGGVFGADGGFTFSQADSSSFSVTKAAGLEIKASGNADGIDHGQDLFILALNPTVTVREQNGNLYWKPGYDGPSLVRYQVYASELRNPATMRPAVASEFANRGLVTEDYQTILSLDPFGGTVASSSGSRHGIDTAIVGGIHEVSTGTGPALDGRRFRVTAWSLPYVPPLQSPACNGGVCACSSTTIMLKNEFVSEKTGENETEYSVGISSGFGSWLKASETFTWTTSSSTTSTTDSSQSASATLVCPSINYTGPTNVQVYWDSLFGTFLFMPYELSAASIIQQGSVKDASGKPVAGRRVDLSYGGKTYHTLTSQNGSYKFFGARTHGAGLQSATVTVGNVRKHLQLGSPEPTMFQLP
jgi:hypothetical protein